ncbi:phosphoglycerate mutase [Roridomyces roridus]|uniref:Phosphoglycerate mutase n=1 Tax=Roridomyces roridus TaxID=1738132 RepID=A0AAD7BZ59_9AGAR|nr:phosphoglycerate mutase [Roridomyces roridus]
MLTVTFIRHGQSQDNVKSIWAGWKDAPLSELGVKQAAALGKAFSGTKIDAFYVSDLLRAHDTGKAVFDAHSSPKPPFTVNPKLREQHFGIAEGQPWVIDAPPDQSYDEMFLQGIFPVLKGRDEKFPQGESLNDLARRTDQAIAECVLPHLAAEGDVHIALASHGLCISELVASLLRLDPDSRRDISYAGLFNTAWTRAVVTLKDGKAPLDAHNPPPLTVQITHVNNDDHLLTLHVAEEPIDENSAAARAFFGGKAAI